jgi:intraflagellar transport protein 140
VKEAIHYYSKAHCLTNAIKLAKEHHLDHDLMNLALQGTKEEMLDAAMYYESQPGMDDKAALLYHKVILACLPACLPACVCSDLSVC